MTKKRFFRRCSLRWSWRCRWRRCQHLQDPERMLLNFTPEIMEP